MEATHELSAQAIAQVQQRYAMEQDLRGAIHRNEFQLHFQPLIDAHWQCVTGAEALIRWHHPERGSVPPSLFIPIVEAAGLAEQVGMWVLNAAARQASEWEGGIAGPLRIAINVSANQLHDAKFAEFLSRTLHNHSLDPSCLEIELTEGVASTEDAELARLFAKIRALGVKIAIDDFGTGYSSFSTLRQLTFDKIKIDREFITDVHLRPQSQAICQSIIALGRGLDIRVLAEGVETAEEFRWLSQHGCRHFQGYYFFASAVGRRFPELHQRPGEPCGVAPVARRHPPNRENDIMTIAAQKRTCRHLQRTVVLAAALALAGCASGPKPGAVSTPANSAQSINAIAEHLNQGDVSAARKLIKSGLKQEPNNPSLALLRDSIARDPVELLGPQSFDYVVQPGDTLVSIAQRHLGNRLLTYQLARYNGIEKPTTLTAGQTLRIPGTRQAPARRTATPAPRPHRRRPYRVRSLPNRRSRRPPPGVTPPPLASCGRRDWPRSTKGPPRARCSFLRRASALDPANSVIKADLARAERIEATVRSRR